MTNRRRFLSTLGAAVAGTQVTPAKAKPDQPVAHQFRRYPCGCTATSNARDPLPSYCPEHACKICHGEGRIPRVRVGGVYGDIWEPENFAYYELCPNDACVRELLERLNGKKA